MEPSRQFGPWAPDLDPAERLARLRSLRTAARIMAGPRAASLVLLLARAERDSDALGPAADALDRLEPLDRRRILSAFAGATYASAGTRPMARPVLASTPRPRSPPRATPRLVRRRLPRRRFAA